MRHVVLFALAMALACSRRAPDGAEPGSERVANAAESAASAAVRAAPEVSASPAPSAQAGRDAGGESLYAFKGRFTDQTGAEVGLDVFSGHPTLTAMFYASCPMACPTLISDIKALDKELSAAARAKVRVLLVSFDKERDTPAALIELARRHKVDERWRFAVASEDTARELAALLDIQYRKTEDGEFSHSTKITLLDQTGRIRAAIDGLNRPSTELVRELETIASAPELAKPL